MNREIKFRGKHIHILKENQKLNGTWVYGYLCNENYIFSEKLGGDMLVDKNTIGQYTGLKDKNGKKIFEGDIIDIHQTVNGYNQFVIVYNNYQFTAEYYNEKTKRRTHRFYEYDLNELFEINECEKEIEVISNIYEDNLESKGE